VTALAAILIGYWLLFAAHPLPGPDFDWKAAGVEPSAATHADGFAGHWGKNTNPAWRFDVWFLNQFPRPKPFAYNAGGYATLSFIPTLGTMILGLLAGGVLQDDRPARGRVVRLAACGAGGLAAGWLLGAAGVCPVVKRIWTPSWVLFSGGWCFLFLAGFYQVLDVWGLKRWAFPLVVVGANSLAAYLIAHLIDGFIADALDRHLGKDWAKLFGDGYASLVNGAAVLLAEWLILLWMYRRKLFVRV
jgi:predicted acyltransferase